MAKRVETGFWIGVRQLMAERKLTQADIARATGLTENTVARYSRGEIQPTWEIVLRFCDAFEVRPSWFWVKKAERIAYQKAE